MKKVTQKQAEFVLQEVAKWLGNKGMGEPSCPEGKELGRYFEHVEDNSPCLDCKFGPAPTGPEAAYKGIGPELQMNFEGWWSGHTYPAVILESGYAPDDWAVACVDHVQKAADAKEMNIFVEPATGWALGIFRED